MAATLSINGLGDGLATAAGCVLQLLGAPAFCLGVAASVALLDTLIFTSYGLGLFAQVGPAACLAIAAGIASVLALSSRWWLARYRFGARHHADHLLRTYGHGGREIARWYRALPAKGRQTERIARAARAAAADPDVTAARSEAPAHAERARDVLGRTAQERGGIGDSLLQRARTADDARERVDAVREVRA